LESIKEKELQMNLFRNPGWIDSALLSYTKLDEIPDSRIEEIRSRLKSVISQNPIVTVIIAAWNEELNLISCLDSLSKSNTEIPFDIIVVNNNSTDRTQAVLDRLGVQSFFQPMQGVGPSRQLGQQHAKGKFILSADADCLYPSKWIDLMTRTLMIEGNSFVYGRFSYLSDKNNSRIKLFFYELARDIMSEFRHIKRPYLNAYGISLGYIKENGEKEGYLNKHMRGFDGRLCFDMMKYGKVAIIRSAQAKAWTGTRAIERDGSFFTAVMKRVLREFARFDNYFTKAKPHDTKNSKNADYSIKNSIKTIKEKYNPFQGSKK
jgi:glycosyltransferase involved in cell wall biosynthesis